MLFVYLSLLYFLFQCFVNIRLHVKKQCAARLDGINLMSIFRRDRLYPAMDLPEIKKVPPSRLDAHVQRQSFLPVVTISQGSVYLHAMLVHVGTECFDEQRRKKSFVVIFVLVAVPSGPRLELPHGWLAFLLACDPVDGIGH